MKIRLVANNDRRSDVDVTLDEQEKLYVFGEETPEGKRVLCLEDLPGFKNRNRSQRRAIAR